jgi:hypothetical protein
MRDELWGMGCCQRGGGQTGAFAYTIRQLHPIACKPNGIHAIALPLAFDEFAGERIDFALCLVRVSSTLNRPHLNRVRSEVEEKPFQTKRRRLPSHPPLA